jgi:hypothetical protein
MVEDAKVGAVVEDAVARTGEDRAALSAAMLAEVIGQQRDELGWMGTVRSSPGAR